jgi:hypothetical protein|tara:strand:+ start:336 stop:527 length:192 start_codon:yes stop_codon:yes gene_type:complete
MILTTNGVTIMLGKILLSLGIGITAISLIANAIELVIISFIIVGLATLGLIWYEGGKELRKEE